MVRLTLEDGTNEADEQTALDSLRNQGEVIDAVRTSVVDPDVGGEFDWDAAYQLDDLDSYREYVKAPAYRHDIHAKIADLHARRYAGDPELVELVQSLPSYAGSSNPQA